MRSMTLPICFLLTAAYGCSGDELTPQRPQIVIEALADTGQTALENPATLDLGEVPLFGVETARFTVRNVGTARLDISNIVETSAVEGTFTIVSFPERLDPSESGELIIDFSPLSDAVVGEGVFDVQSNDSEAGINGQAVVRGAGLFVGTPTLQVCYNGQCYPQAEQCTAGECTLPALAFGNVPLGGTGSQVVTLRNEPGEGTCIAPPNSPECTRVCQLTVASNPAGANAGFALERGTEFGVAGTVTLPFTVDVPLDGCDVTAEQQALIRVTAGTTEDTVQDTLVIESNDPNATLVRVPLTATIREAPTAVAQLKACDVANPSEPCSIEGETRPLDRFFLDGSSSFDPDGLAIVRYAWEVIATPGDIPPSTLAPEGLDTATPSFVAPVAGTYSLRLTVENEDGIVSGVSETSDIEVAAIPNSRVSIELTWRDDQDVDLDLHLTRAVAGHRLCLSSDDCFWRSCRPSCESTPGCVTANWFGGDPFEGPNPRLDADDIDGPGPETINVDTPEEGRYRVYVHYFGINNPAQTGPMPAVVRVLLDGVPRGEYRRTLQRNEVWRIADIVWDALGGSVEELGSDGEGVGETRFLEQCLVSGHDFDVLGN